MRKTFSLSLLLALPFTLAFGQAGNPIPKSPSSLADTIKLVSPSVVQITYQMDQFPEETRRALGRLFLSGPAGTGFIVNEDGYVITALHVLSFFDNVHGFPVGGHTYPAGRNRLLVGIPFANTDTGRLKMRAAYSEISFTVVDTDSVHDLALLKIERRGFVLGAARPRTAKYVATFSVARPEDGEEIAVSGYPLGKSVLVTTSGAVASSWGYEETNEALLGRPGLTVPGTKDIFLVDLHLNHGNSGGPVYSIETGAVVGVADAYALEDNVMLAPSPGDKPDPAFDQASGRALVTNAGLGIVVPARYVVALLEKNNVKWQEK